MIFYICDGKACGEECPNPECKHTSDIKHAKNFRHCEELEYDEEYWEEKEELNEL